MILLVLVIGPAIADSFGRFGYGSHPGVSDLIVSDLGVCADRPGATCLQFLSPIKKLIAESTHATAQISSVEGDPGCPKKIRSSLVGNSVDLFFNDGIKLRFETKDPPFLNWPEGSVGPNVPTPDLKWALLSFSDAQPPYLFGFSGASQSLKVEGGEGHWTLSGSGFSGWLRIWLPFGIDPRYATDASGLGELSKSVAEYSWLWQTPTPSVQRVVVKADDLGVDATWKFDGAGAFIPQAPILAQLGGSALQVVSPYHTLSAIGNTGPYSVLEGMELTLHFPCRKFKFGRAVGLGTCGTNQTPVDPAHEAANVVDLACRTLLAAEDDSVLRRADEAVTRFLVDATYTLEPDTRQQLPFDEDGVGLELASANCFLAQTAMIAVSSDQPNALFDSILWKRDWWTWMIVAKDPDNSRRATALTALAGAMSSTPEGRLYGATLEAGLDAQLGERVYRTRKKLPVANNQLTEPLIALRQGIFVLSRPTAETGPTFYDLVQSPVRVGTGPALTSKKLEDGYALDWVSKEGKPSEFSLLSPGQIEVVSDQNLKARSEQLVSAGLIVRYIPKAKGLCSIKIRSPLLPKELPLEVPVPRY